MPLILAIEPDPNQAAALKRLVRERVRGDLVLADSKDAAIAAIRTEVPDLILVTALLSPRDEVELTDHLRSLDGADHLQTLTIPLLASAAPEPRPARKKGLLNAFKRQSPNKTGTDGCDPAVFATEIRGYLERAGEMRSERQAREQAPAEDTVATVERPLADPAPVETSSAPLLTRVPEEPVEPDEIPITFEDFEIEERTEELAVDARASTGLVLKERAALTTVSSNVDHEAEAPQSAESSSTTEPEWLAAIIEDLRRGAGGSTPTVELVSEAEPPQFAFELEIAAALEPEPGTFVLSPSTPVRPELVEGRPELRAGLSKGEGQAEPAPIVVAPAASDALPQVEAEETRRVAPQEMPIPRDTEWITGAIEALRLDIDRLRTERTLPRQAPARAPSMRRSPGPIIAAAAAREAEAEEPPAWKPAAKRIRDRRARPLVDEWGFYDPDRCGIEALIARVEQDREEEPVEDRFEPGAAVPAFALPSAEAAIDPAHSQPAITPAQSATGTPVERLEPAAEPAGTGLPPLTRWARLEWEPINVPIASREPDDVRGVLRGLAIPSEIACVQYATGCRIRRVRFAARQRARRANGAREPVLILSRKRLRELQAGSPKEESSSVMMRA